MKRFLPLIAFLGIIGIGFIARANFCCERGQEEACCAQIGRVYCPSENACRTRCLCEEEETCSGNQCKNENGNCCSECPSVSDC